MQVHNSRIFTNDNCTGCNRCISACTVAEANYVVSEGGTNKIYIDSEKCINCGKCLEACPHDARDYLDDTERFLDRLSNGRVSIVTAPAIRSNFPQYENLLGTLRKMGARYIYDTSFGADICTWGYIRYIQKNRSTGLISQPCPAVVNYIERHNPALLPLLAPIHSPAMCVAVYMRKYKKIDGEFAFLSPCVSKKDEFDDANTNQHFQYNVTFQKLAEALKARGIDYRSGAKDQFDNEQHGMGSIYPMPGGLKSTVHRFIPDAWVYQVEGQPEVRHFLDSYASTPASSRPFLVDILNCMKGCNIGTGAICSMKDDLASSKVMYEAEQAARAGNGKRSVLPKKSSTPGMTLEDFDKMLDLSDFVRRYTPKPAKVIPTTPKQIEAAYQALYKATPESRCIDCGSCGYSTCEDMATVIAKGLNLVENCVEYNKSILSIHQQEIEQMLANREQTSLDLRENVQTIFDSMSSSTQRTEHTVEQVGQITEEVDALRDIAGKLNEMVDTLSVQIGEYIRLGSSIVSISTQTKLLSMNASVEAAHAHELGKGFAVVAEEMKNLSDQSAESAQKIIASNERVVPLLEEVRSFSGTLDKRSKNIFQSTQSIMHAVQEIGQTEQEIADAAARIVSE